MIFVSHRNIQTTKVQTLHHFLFQCHQVSQVSICDHVNYMHNHSADTVHTLTSWHCCLPQIPPCLYQPTSISSPSKRHLRTSMFTPELRSKCPRVGFKAAHARPIPPPAYTASQPVNSALPYDLPSYTYTKHKSSFWPNARLRLAISLHMHDIPLSSELYCLDEDQVPLCYVSGREGLAGGVDIAALGMTGCRIATWRACSVV